MGYAPAALSLSRGSNLSLGERRTKSCPALMAATVSDFVCAPRLNEKVQLFGSLRSSNFCRFEEEGFGLNRRFRKFVLGKNCGFMLY